MRLGILKASEPYEIISNLIAISQGDTFRIVRFPPQNGRLRSLGSKINQLDGSLLGYYDVPLLLTTDGEFFALTSDDQVVAAVQQQVDGCARLPMAAARSSTPRSPS
jgi:hypothetical protein